jgi:hypothetical protein
MNLRLTVIGCARNVALLALLAIGAISGWARANAAHPPPVRNIVLVHGVWASGSWAAIVSRSRRGIVMKVSFISFVVGPGVEICMA